MTKPRVVVQLFGHRLPPGASPCAAHRLQPPLHAEQHATCLAHDHLHYARPVLRHSQPPPLQAPMTAMGRQRTAPQRHHQRHANTRSGCRDPKLQTRRVLAPFARQRCWLPFDLPSPQRYRAAPPSSRLCSLEHSRLPQRVALMRPPRLPLHEPRKASRAARQRARAVCRTAARSLACAPAPR